MRVVINSKEKEIEGHSISLLNLLRKENVSQPEMVAVQLNGLFIKREDYEKILIHDNDVVDYVYFMGGGQIQLTGFSTKVIHASYPKKDQHNALLMPIYSNAAFEFEKAEDMENAFNGRLYAHIYSRISNPTVENFEQKVKSMTGALSVTALSSGMAAIANTIITLLQQGDHIITSSHLFGNTYSLFSSTLRDLGIEVTFLDLTNPDEIIKNINGKTKVIFFETITNPQLEVVDITKLSEIARAHDLVLIADTTLTPPNIFNAQKFGIDIEIVSSTKIMSGGATSIGGLIIDYGKYNWSKLNKLKKYYEQYGHFAFTAKLKKEVFRNLGSCLSPYHAYLQSIGLETLSLRYEKAAYNAFSIAEFLKDYNNKVINVNYPGLKESNFYEISIKQFTKYPCSMLTFNFRSKAECFKFLNKLQIIRRATNISDNKTLILHPASTIFSEYSVQEREKLGVSDTLIRLTTGIEDIEDLIEDISQAINN